MSNGVFIVVDGIDGAGKTTQVQRFTELFEKAGEAVVCSKEPTNGPWGKRIRESATGGRMELRDELDAFVQDRTEHVQNLIQPSLDAGKIVIVDRYFYSTITYQGVRGGDVGELTRLMREGFPVPDVAFVLDLPAPLAVSRISDSRGDTPNEFENTDSLAAIRNLFLQLSEDCPEIKMIDSAVNEDQVSAQIAKHLESIIRDKRCAKRYPCDELWCAFRKIGECDWAEIKTVFQREIA